ncbi:hypothetical protein N0O92_17090 [Alkalihalobacillus sp. MEB130]|uniref:hypothetical protein n=1 Tax=Alkalihalobacillus sp. MEB130 TaxID=2976704 RepID=UPI0028DDC067|nr:hypothetical protein [Alkalihalobacillus sp. MEB130]MDT8861926.1 hypothetical protein [Alkalihalobacillus sp. MEB130]
MKNSIIYEQPLLGKISIHQVNGNIVNSKLSTIVLLEIKTKSIVFVSQLKFPLSESVIYQIDTKISDNEIQLFGLILKSVSNVHSNSHHYQFDYIMENEPSAITYFSELQTVLGGGNKNANKANKEI